MIRYLHNFQIFCIFALYYLQIQMLVGEPVHLNFLEDASIWR